jgi:hypothetical protein
MISPEQKQLIIHHLQPLRPSRIGIFGSYARNENKPESDLDILVAVDYSTRPSLLDIIGIQQDLSDALGINVDLVTEKSLSEYIRPYVEKDLTIIFE